MATDGNPLLLIDNSTMYVIGKGTYKVESMSFAEAKAIIDIFGEEDVLRCYTDSAIDKVIHDYVKYARRSGCDRVQAAYRAVRDAADHRHGRRRAGAEDPEYLHLLRDHHPHDVNKSIRDSRVPIGMRLFFYQFLQKYESFINLAFSI